jgi:hypothetical protein
MCSQIRRQVIFGTAGEMRVDEQPPAIFQLDEIAFAVAWIAWLARQRQMPLQR